jgi:predicted esterase
LNIIRRKGTKLDGQHPTILSGYGGFGLSQTPFFDPSLSAWLDAGGVLAIANLRGGDEFGEDWHRAGMLTQKQNVFDDFIACAEHLIKAAYTNPAKLAIEGGSNGGLLMGAVLTQRPDLFRVVVSISGIYDMLRSETTENGQFNVTEYGSVKNPEAFTALYAYSPYQHVKDGTKYPSILFTVGENDPRVDPWHSRKMIARLQAANASKNPILLIRFSNAGHGGMAPRRTNALPWRPTGRNSFISNSASNGLVRLCTHDSKHHRCRRHWPLGNFREQGLWPALPGAPRIARKCQYASGRRALCASITRQNPASSQGAAQTLPQLLAAEKADRFRAGKQEGENERTTVFCSHD